jgi:predicted outer membrane lipoprotein
MAEATTPAARATAWLVGGIVLLAAAFGIIAYTLNPASLRTDALRFLAIALVAALVVRGMRWARLLLVVLTGLAAAFAVLTAVSLSMAPLWKLVFFLYGGGTIACLWGLFVQPAAAHFLTVPPVPKGGA